MFAYVQFSDMVCYDEGSAQCIISNMMPGATKMKITLMVRPSYTVVKLFNDIKTQLDVDNFDILLQKSKEAKEIIISEQDDRTLSEIGIDFSSAKKRTTLKLVPFRSNSQRRSAIVTANEADSTVPKISDDDELALGASASPVESNSPPIILPLFSEEPTSACNNDSISLYPCK